MTETKNAKGIVSWVSKFGFQIDNVDEWYNGEGVGQVVNKGDSIEFEYIENEGKIPGKLFRNVAPEDIKVLSSVPSEPTQSGPSGQEIGLRKKNAVKCVCEAVRFLSNQIDKDGKKDVSKINLVVIKELALGWYNIAMEIADEFDSKKDEPAAEPEESPN